jgi:hypothetical protein
MSRRARKAGGTVKSSSLGLHSPSQSIDVVGNCIVPQKLQTVLRWVSFNNTLSMSSTQSAYTAVTLNGLYDPLFALGGGSCTGFTELMALYNRYIVTHCSIRMNLRNTSSTSVGNDIVGYILQVPSTQTNLVGSVVSEDILEARRCLTETIPYNNANQYKEMVDLNIDLCQLEALPSLIAAYDAMSGTRSSNPNRTPIALCGVTRPGGTQASTQAEQLLVLEFKVVFYQPTTFTTL